MADACQNLVWSGSIDGGVVCGGKLETTYVLFQVGFAATVCIECGDVRALLLKDKSTDAGPTGEGSDGRQRPA